MKIALHLLMLTTLGSTSFVSAQTATTVPSPQTQATATGGASQPIPDATAKKPGVIRIGIVTPHYEGNKGTSGADAIRELEAQNLVGPKTEVVKLTAMLPVQATAEAKADNCDFVLTSSLTQAEKKSGFGNLRGLASAASFVPGLGMATRTGAVITSTAVAATSAVQAASMVAEFTGGMKAKTEVSFEYALVSLATGQKVLGDSQKVKVESDGQDVVTPLVQTAATAIVNHANK